jgi:hypothetical protein
MSHDFQDAVQDESSIPIDFLTYWMHHDVLAHNVVHHSNIEWIHKTAQHGDLKPHHLFKEENLSIIVDSHDCEEQESIFFDAISSPTEKEPLADKGSVRIYTKKLLLVDMGSVSLFDPYKKNESHLDTRIEPRYPYSGYSQLNQWCYKQPAVDSSTIFVQMQDKEDYKTYGTLVTSFHLQRPQKLNFLQERRRPSLFKTPSLE